jgi:hypothetical protein
VVDRRDLRVDDVLGAPLQAVLADDDRPALAGLEVLRQEQDAGGDDVRIDVELHAVARPLGSSYSRTAFGFRGPEAVGEAADQLLVEGPAIGFGRLGPPRGGELSALDQ